MRYLLILLGAVALLAAPVSAQPMTPAALQSALKAAKNGTVIDLGDAQMGAVTLSRLAFDPPVVIKGGHFKQLTISGVSGLTLDGFALTVPPVSGLTTNSQAIRVWQSSGITLQQCRLVGALAPDGIEQDTPPIPAPPTRTVKGLPIGKGIAADQSSNLRIDGCDISQFYLGVSIANTKGVAIVGNDIHDTRTSFINGGGSTDIVVERNRGWNMTPWAFGGSGDHGDDTHFWTQPGMTERVRITVRDNLFTHFEGTAPLGIYLDDNTNLIGFDADVSGNVIVSGHAGGIRLENVRGTVDNNTLIWSGRGREYNDTPRVLLTTQSGPTVISNNRSMVQFYKMSDAEIAANVLTANTLTTPADADQAIADWTAKFRPGQTTPAPDPVPTPDPAPVTDPAPLPAPTPSDPGELQVRLEKARTEVNGLKNAASRALYAIDKAIEIVGPTP